MHLVPKGIRNYKYYVTWE